MRKKERTSYRIAAVIGLLFICCCMPLHAQEGLHIAVLFDKYGKQKSVTMVELNGSILDSYHMTTYKSLVFEDVTPYLNDILGCLKKDVAAVRVEKTQEITEGGVLSSAYYRLEPVSRGKRTVNRYILFKRGKNAKATLVYIEGPLGEKELMDILYN